MCQPRENLKYLLVLRKCSPLGQGERLVSLQFSTTPSAMQPSEVRLLPVLQGSFYYYKVRASVLAV